MTHPTTIRLDDETYRELSDLAHYYKSRSAAIKSAIHRAWKQRQEELLDEAYASAVADNPAYPYESERERATLRARRNARQADA